MPDETIGDTGSRQTRKVALSLVLGSRNDQYMGNSRWRLQTALNYVAKQVHELGRSDEVEVIVTDWGSEIPLQDALRLSPAAARIVSFLAVPPDVAHELQRDSPFPEVLTVNAAARRANGKYIGRVDQDTLVGKRFLETFFELHEGRRQLAVALHSALMFANLRMVPYRFAVRCPSFWAVDRFVGRFGRRLKIELTPHRPFHAHGVGLWLIHRDLWQECGGYDERMIYPNETEINMIARLIKRHEMVDLGKLVNYDFYHLEHYHSLEPRRSGRYRKVNPRLPFARPDRPNPNGDDWGLFRHSLKVLPYAGKPGKAAGGKPPFALPRYLFLLALAGTQIACDKLVLLPLATAYALWSRRAGTAWKALRGESPVRWPGLLKTLWQQRKARASLRLFLQSAGLLGVGRRFRRRSAELVKFLRDPAYRQRKRAERERFRQFKEKYQHLFKPGPDTGNAAQKTVLILSRHFIPIELQLVLFKALVLAGFRPIVLTVSRPSLIGKIHRWAGARAVHDWRTFIEPLEFGAAAASVMEKHESIEALQGFSYAGIRCGKIAVATAFRQLRTGSLDFQSPHIKQVLVSEIASAMSSATAAQSILRRFRPHMMLSFDVEYTPGGEFFEMCMEDGVPVVTYREGHKSSTLILKRYGPHNRDQNPVSLSDESWEMIRTMQWGESRRGQLRDELFKNYAGGDWYGLSNPQSNSRLFDAEAIRKRLGLSSERKVAFIFAHIPWDAPLRWGHDLFQNYEEWLIETVRQACANENVHWVIKIHPANVGKKLKGRYLEEPAEVVALRRAFGELPPHVSLIPADSDISSYALLALMDYCVTVRGTIGIEAASLGIPVLTAGTGRYERKGFTIDSESREQYLDRIARIQDIERLSPAEQELAERFAYGIFLMRPFPLRALSLNQIARSDAPRATINIASVGGWRNSPDLKAFAQWINASRNPDFLAAEGGQP